MSFTKLTEDEKSIANVNTLRMALDVAYVEIDALRERDSTHGYFMTWTEREKEKAEIETLKAEIERLTALNAGAKAGEALECLKKLGQAAWDNGMRAKEVEKLEQPIRFALSYPPSPNQDEAVKALLYQAQLVSTGFIHYYKINPHIVKDLPGFKELVEFAESFLTSLRAQQKED